MSKRTLLALISLATSVVRADVASDQGGFLEIPITPFSNMASGYQATNPGFRAVLRSADGKYFIAGGPLTMDAVINGYSDDASQGSAYGRLVLRLEPAPIPLSSGTLASVPTGGTHQGLFSICMAEDDTVPVNETVCKHLGGNIHPERPFQWINKKVDFAIDEKGTIRITRYYGDTGEGGTSQQLSLAVFHPAYGFAAPGKAFKDYQSPLVLDLNHDGQLNLVNVWDDAHPVRFDLMGTGKRLRTGWVQKTDGFLFVDDGSGCVQNGTQLFGEYTRSIKGEKTYENGFIALSKLLDPRGTGRVVAQAHPELKVWRDLNQDGICQANEVAAASKYVKTIATRFTTIQNPPLTEDNEIRLVGNYVGVDGKSHTIGDVWFKQRRHENAVASK